MPLNILQGLAHVGHAVQNNGMAVADVGAAGFAVYQNNRQIRNQQRIMAMVQSGASQPSREVLETTLVSFVFGHVRISVATNGVQTIHDLLMRASDYGADIEVDGTIRSALVDSSLPSASIRAVKGKASLFKYPLGVYEALASGIRHLKGVALMTQQGQKKKLVVVERGLDPLRDIEGNELKIEESDSDFFALNLTKDDTLKIYFVSMDYQKIDPVGFLAEPVSKKGAFNCLPFGERSRWYKRRREASAHIIFPDNTTISFNPLDPNDQERRGRPGREILQDGKNSRLLDFEFKDSTTRGFRRGSKILDYISVRKPDGSFWKFQSMDTPTEILSVQWLVVQQKDGEGKLVPLFEGTKANDFATQPTFHDFTVEPGMTIHFRVLIILKIPNGNDEAGAGIKSYQPEGFSYKPQSSAPAMLSKEMRV